MTDWVTGTDSADTINLRSGADADAFNANALGGDDIVYGDDDDNVVFAGAGADFVTGDGGNDSLWGEAGDDVLDGGSGHDTAQYRIAGNGVLSYRIVGNEVIFYSDGVEVLKVDISSPGYATATGLGGEAALGTDTLFSIETLSIHNDTSALGIQVGPSDPNSPYPYVPGGSGADSIDLTAAAWIGATNAHGEGGDDEILGSAGANYLSGGDGEDIISGGEGDDHVVGEAGNDTLDGGAGSDFASFSLWPLTGALQLVAGTAPGTLEVRLDNGGVTETVAILSRTDGVITVEGVGPAALIIGTDTVTGVEALLFSSNGGSLFVPTEVRQFGDYVDGTAFADAYSLDDFSGSVNTNAGLGDDIVIGSAANNFMDGGAGDDSLNGGGGNDYLLGGGGSDALDGGTGESDIVSFQLPAGTTGSLRLVDGTGANSGILFVELVNGDDSEILFKVTPDGEGGATVEAMGSAAAFGTDTLADVENADFFVSGTGDWENQYVNIQLAPRQFGDWVGGSDAADLLDLASFPGALNASGNRGDDTILGTDAINNLDGAAGADTLLGGGGDDYLVGGAGNDSLDGGTGSGDVASFQIEAPVSGSMIILDGVGPDAGKLLIQLVDGSNVETLFKVTIGEAGSATVEAVGSAAHLGVDTVSNVDELHFFPQGNLVPDQIAVVRLTPRQFDDFVAGGEAADSIDLADYSGAVNAGGNRGDDTIYGNDQGNFLTGDAGDDALYGRGGDDHLVGQSGDDRAYGEDGNDWVFGFHGNDLLDGGAGHDVLRGFAGDDHLVGGDGNDFLAGDEFAGPAGDDVIEGGAGFDRVSYFNAFNGVTVDLSVSGGQATGRGFDSLAGVEHLGGTDFADTLAGDGGDNHLLSYAGDDTLLGRDGNDLISIGVGNKTADGGAGIDTLAADQGSGGVGVSISLDLQGSEQATGLGSLVLTGFENLSGTTADDNLTGDGGANLLAGSGGADVLLGGGGDDVLLGDGLVLEDFTPGRIGQGLGGPIATEQSLPSWYTALGDDTLSGGEGDDVIVGGGGADTLTGGGGRDRFVYLSTEESGPSAADFITDFQLGGTALAPNARGVGPLRRPTNADVLETTGGRGENGIAHRPDGAAGGDIIDLSAIDANTTLDGDQAFRLVQGGFTGTAGEAFLEFDAGSGLTHLFLDVDGNGIADMTIGFSGDLTAMTAANMVF